MAMASINTATGYQALYNNTTLFSDTNPPFAIINAVSNTAYGAQALFKNDLGSYNTAVGAEALYNNTNNENTAIGAFALVNNTIGSGNAAVGSSALASNTSGGGNTAIGDIALLANTTGGGNTAIGFIALALNRTGTSNTATGERAIGANTTGGANTATGSGALVNNTTGNSNIGLGFFAGENLTIGSNNIDIGNIGVGGEAKTIRIGNTVATVYPDGLTRPAQTHTFIAGIRGITTGNANAIPVVIDSAGQLGTVSSSRRFKNEIKSMDKVSEAILALKPVTFHYKNDNTGTPQFGLIAEEVAKVNPDLIVRDENGEIYTVRYEAVNAMLLNEFIKEHRKVEQLTKDFESKLAEQQKQIEALTAGLQKVSAQLETSKPASQVVNYP